MSIPAVDVLGWPPEPAEHYASQNNPVLDGPLSA